MYKNKTPVYFWHKEVDLGFKLWRPQLFAVGQWLRCCATNRNVAGSIPAGVNGFFVDIKSFRTHCGPGVDSASNRNEYREYLLGGKGGRCARLTILPPSCAVVTKSGNLNFLEPSGPVQACNGTDLLAKLFSSPRQMIDYSWNVMAHDDVGRGSEGETGGWSG